MTRFTLIALKMALPSATSVCQDVRHPRAHYAVHTHLAETHISRTASDHSVASVGWYREVTLFRPVVWHPCQVEAKWKSERKEKQQQSSGKVGDRFCKHLDVLCNVSKTSLEWKKKGSVCDILSEKMEYLLNRFNISAHTYRTFYSLGISPPPMQTLVQNILHSVYWGIHCVFALMQICQMSLKSHEIICLVQGAS